MLLVNDSEKTDRLLWSAGAIECQSNDDRGVRRTERWNECDFFILILFGSLATFLISVTVVPFSFRIQYPLISTCEKYVHVVRVRSSSFRLDEFRIMRDGLAGPQKQKTI